MKKAVFLISLLIAFSLVFSGIILAQSKKGGAVVAGNDASVSGAGASRGISDNLRQ